MGRIVFVFKPDCKYPWMAPLLKHQYKTDLCAKSLLECRNDINDKYTFYKTDYDDIKYYAISPAFCQDNLLVLIVENIPNTPILAQMISRKVLLHQPKLIFMKV